MIQCVCGDSDAPGPDWDEDECDIMFEQHSTVSLVDLECVECKGEIPVGTEYEHTWGVWEGDESTFSTCLACARIRTDFCCDGVGFGELWLTLREAFRDIKGSDDLEWLIP